MISFPKGIICCFSSRYIKQGPAGARRLRECFYRLLYLKKEEKNGTASAEFTGADFFDTYRKESPGRPPLSNFPSSSNGCRPFAVHFGTSSNSSIIPLHQKRLLVENLSVPIIPINSSICILPLIGAVDAKRTSIIEEKVLTEK